MGGFDPAVFEPCTTEEYPTPAPRPSNSVLASERLGVLGLGEMPHYRGGLARAVESLIERGVV
jgi:dTDP-4-dehydrorhamnose reductase